MSSISIIGLGNMARALADRALAGGNAVEGDWMGWTRPGRVEGNASPAGRSNDIDDISEALWSGGGLAAGLEQRDALWPSIRGWSRRVVRRRGGDVLVTSPVLKSPFVICVRAESRGISISP
jgi:hypothetical protein